ncbi:MAG: hypothetical protein FJY56_08230 [Betaproteobacteria bacterium]|nr:hypothetical protein [Betaproteobacteria bacterium]
MAALGARAFDARLNGIVLALLAGNTLYFGYSGRFSEALDSIAWYVLLILFMIETARARPLCAAHGFTWMHALRALATLAIAASLVLYVREQEWLDAANLFLWIAVVALLEIEMRYPAQVAAHHRQFAATATLLYGALGVLVLIWLARHEWMDAWDAAIWLAAFGLLELRILATDT